MPELPTSTENLEELATARVLFKLLNLASSAENIELAFIILTIQIGILEGRPMDISALAAMTGLPRTTVLRKLRDFEQRTGRLRWQSKGSRRIPLIDPDFSLWGKHLKTAARLMRQYVDLLSILDKSAFDPAETVS
ncbi:hypothetical protein SAMN05216548_11460 [Faunimonas pinastri]|uniref:Uncharacterized protein n=1 Tax=Faunimonas pinastri TaxID=1855383 RepID=A0A1H9MUV1_9HYPH|nr:hypothetical protein [Faunimonas pinastri]SER27462.1 hypothetical protein SAMN05216548_11460 [Faunimonas pinastri]